MEFQSVSDAMTTASPRLRVTTTGAPILDHPVHHLLEAGAGIRIGENVHPKGLRPDSVVRLFVQIKTPWDGVAIAQRTTGSRIILTTTRRPGTDAPES